MIKSVTPYGKDNAWCEVCKRRCNTPEHGPVPSNIKRDRQKHDHMQCLHRHGTFRSKHYPGGLLMKEFKIYYSVRNNCVKQLTVIKEKNELLALREFIHLIIVSSEYCSDEIHNIEVKEI